ncbi:hypothetical protein TNCV_1519881 [Trichonephila clavipes]|nr:hypothetical protein TNCV_1519881 [Trichonephila clavipes]
MWPSPEGKEGQLAPTPRRCSAGCLSTRNAVLHLLWPAVYLPNIRTKNVEIKILDYVWNQDRSSLMFIVKNSCGQPCRVIGFKIGVTEDPPCRGAEAQSPYLGVLWKFRVGVPAHVLSSSLDCSSKLRSPLPIALVLLQSDIN